MLNDARMASLVFFKDNVCTTRISNEKSLKSSSRSSKNSPKFCQTIASTVGGNKKLRFCSGQIRTLVAMTTYSSYRRIMGSRGNRHVSVSMGIFGLFTEMFIE